jgi:hypothetical protein
MAMISLAGSWDVAARRALAATVLVGVLVAAAPVLPPAFQPGLLSASLAVWVAAIATATWRAAAAIRYTPPDRGVDWIVALGVVGIVVSLVFALQLELLRTVLHGPAFTWHWRWNLNHAQALARYGGIGQALDYVGAGVDYHVGPAWLAGATQQVLGRGLSHVLFGLIPSLCVLASVVGALALLKAFDVPYRIGALATALALTMPLPDATPWGTYYALHGALLSPASWPFLTAKLMMNSLLALAVGLASMALIFDRGASKAIVCVGAAGLASLVVIKPQYYAAFTLVAALAAGSRVVIDPGSSGARSMAAAVASVMLALALLTLAPADIPMLAAPQWPRPERPAFWHEPFRLSSLLAVVALAIWRLGPRLWERRPPAAALVLGSWLALLILSGIFHLVEFPCKPEVVSRWTMLGLPPSKACYGAPSAAAGRDGLGQSLEAARFAVLAGGFAIFGAAAARVRRGALVFAAAAGMTVASPVPLGVVGFVRPALAYGVAEDPDLLTALSHVPVRDTLLVASDLADPAEDFARPLQGMLLTAYRGHQFYVSNLAYLHYARPDAVTRLQELQSFFGSSWTNWHTRWLADKRLTHVLISRRCPAAWLDQPAVPLRPVAHAGTWSVFAVPSALPVALTPQPAPQPVRPAYGRSGCLSGNPVPIHTAQR